MDEKLIFISHSTKDRKVAEMLVDLFTSMGVDRKSIFCSSLPGIGVKQEINKEIKDNLKSSKLDIIILSNAYYDSEYCLNEMGVIWYKDNSSIIVIAMPEINENNMKGFINNDYAFRRLSEKDKVNEICDELMNVLSITNIPHVQVSDAVDKLVEKYNKHISNRIVETKSTKAKDVTFLSKLPNVDDVNCIIYYIAITKKINFSTNDLYMFLQANEIHDIDINNGIDVMEKYKCINTNGISISVSNMFFSSVVNNSDTFIKKYRRVVKKHTELASDKFKKLYKFRAVPNEVLLFAEYLIENETSSYSINSYEYTIKKIKEWENENILKNVVSSRFNKVHDFLKIHNFIYESNWDQFGNPIECKVYKSLILYIGNDDKVQNEIKYLLSEKYY